MKTSLFKSLYFQVLTAIAIGILLGHFYPDIGAQMKPLGDGFVKLIKMIIAPVIFCTVVTGIAGMESMKAVGRTGAVALLYFEIVSTLALIIGLIIVNVVQPGAGMNVDPATLDAKAVAVYAEQAKQQGIIDFLLDVIMVQQTLNQFYAMDSLVGQLNGTSSQLQSTLSNLPGVVSKSK